MPLATPGTKKASADDIGDYEIQEVPDAIQRDQWKRPLIIPKDGGPPVAYTRASTLGKAIEDTYHLNRWTVRAVVLGMSRREELVARAAAIPENEGEHRNALQEIGEEAKAAGGGDRGANIGTALHKLSERRDAGEDLSYLPGPLMDAMDAYGRCMESFEVLATETFVACDPLKTAGTFDRVVRCKVDLEFTHRQLGKTIIPAGTVLVLDLKGLALDTPLPTPTGWTTMAAVQIGDQVIGSDGRPCNVTAKSRTKRIGTYIVTFDDGEQITCDREHLWWVLTGRSVNGRGGDRAREQVIGVEQMRDTLFRYGQRQHRVPVAEALDLPPIDLPIDPYLFGAWLGDGKVSGSDITKDVELFDLLRSDGHEIGPDYRKDDSGIETRCIYGLRTKLRLAGLLGHRVIPDPYLRASIDQRRALLRGLMDTDGTWNVKRQRAVFNSTDKALAMQVVELCLTLGLKPQFNSWLARGYGKEVTAYGVEFLPVDFNPFRLPRKAERVTWEKNEARARNRIVYSVEPGPDVETACIAVDSPNSTYLCGKHMVPTHNTGKNESAKYWGPGYGVQQVVYACGDPYAPKGRMTWEELLGEGVVPSTRWAVLLHVPADSPQDAGLVIVDLDVAASMADLCLEIRTARTNKGLMTDAFPVAPAVETAEDVGVDWDHPDLQWDEQQMAEQIRTAPDVDALEHLWEHHGATWDEEMAGLAKARYTELQAGDEAAEEAAQVAEPTDLLTEQEIEVEVPRQVRKLGLIASLRHATNEAAMEKMFELNEDIWDEDANRMARIRLAELEAEAGVPA